MSLTSPSPRLSDLFRPRNLRRDGRGEPVMFDTRVRADGTAGATDLSVRWRMLTRNHCGLCGDGLGAEVAFIASPQRASSQRFCTPGLHVDCARYLFGAFALFADSGATQVTDSGYVRTPELALYICPSYEVLHRNWWRMRLTHRDTPESAPVVQAAPPTSVEYHRDAASMQRLVDAGGCPEHTELTATGCRAHIDQLDPGERTRLNAADTRPPVHSERSTPAFRNLRDPFRPRNLRIEPDGFPLTYDHSLHADGSPEESSDMYLERRMLRTGRCGVCGDDLGSEVAFIGISTMAARRSFSTPGLHVDCARYAFATCPFIAKPDWKASDDHANASTRTAELVLVISDSYRYSPWRWWYGKLVLRRRRLDFGFSKASTPWHVERHSGRRAMLDHLNALGGCPAHHEQALTGAPAHAPANGCPRH